MDTNGRTAWGSEDDGGLCYMHRSFKDACSQQRFAMVVSDNLPEGQSAKHATVLVCQSRDVQKIKSARSSPERGSSV